MGKTRDGGLTPKQARFVEEYLIDLNATRAYMRAFKVDNKNTARKEGCLLVANPNVNAEINKHTTAEMRALKLSRGKILRELALIGFSDLGDMVKWEGDNAVLLSSAELTRKQRRAVRSVKSTWSKDGGSVSIELHDKISALKELARYAKLTGASDGEDGEHDGGRSGGGKPSRKDVVDRLLGRSKKDGE